MEQTVSVEVYGNRPRASDPWPRGRACDARFSVDGRQFRFLGRPDCLPGGNCPTASSYRRQNPPGSGVHIREDPLRMYEDLERPPRADCDRRRSRRSRRGHHASDSGQTGRSLRWRRWRARLVLAAVDDFTSWSIEACESRRGMRSTTRRQAKRQTRRC